MQIFLYRPKRRSRYFLTILQANEQNKKTKAKNNKQ